MMVLEVGVLRENQEMNICQAFWQEGNFHYVKKVTEKNVSNDLYKWDVKWSAKSQTYKICLCTEEYRIYSLIKINVNKLNSLTKRETLKICKHKIQHYVTTKNTFWKRTVVDKESLIVKEWKKIRKDNLRKAKV